MSELKEIRAIALTNVKEIALLHKEKLEEAYTLAVHLDYIARREGLLALEYEAGFISKDMPMCNEVTEMVEMIVDGTEPDFFSEILTLKFMGNEYKGIDALLYFLYARSMLLIQEGTSMYQIEQLFNAVIPKEILYFDQQRKIVDERHLEKIKQIKNILSETEKNQLKRIENQLSNLTKEEWEKVVSSNGFYGFDKLLPVLEEETQKLVGTYMNAYRVYTIMNYPTLVEENELSQMADDLEEMIHTLREKTESESLLADVLKHNDEEIKELMRNIENRMLALALKGEQEEITDCFYRNLSLRLQYDLQETMEYMGPVRRCDVEEAQRKIMQIAKEKLGWNDLCYN